MGHSFPQKENLFLLTSWVFSATLASGRVFTKESAGHVVYRGIFMKPGWPDENILSLHRP